MPAESEISAKRSPAGGLVDRLAGFVAGGRFALRNRAALAQLEAAPHPRAAGIAQALKALANGSLSDAERDWVRRIEAERKKLENSAEPLADGTLGAGGIFDREKTVQQVAGASKPPREALAIFLLVRALRPGRAIELGTNLGISSAYIAAAQRLNGAGTLVTLESSPYRLRVAAQVHASLGLRAIEYRQGLFKTSLEPALETFGPVDFAFIDGHHMYRPTRDYFALIHRCAAPGAVYVFDDIHYSSGMSRAWNDLAGDSRLGLLVDLGTFGVTAAALDARWPRLISSVNIRE